MLKQVKLFDHELPFNESGCQLKILNRCYSTMVSPVNHIPYEALRCPVKLSMTKPPNLILLLALNLFFDTAPS
jgi:hypothetical protein